MNKSNLSGIKIGILHTQIRGDEKLLIAACETRSIDYVLVDIRDVLFNPLTYKPNFDIALERCVSSTKGMYAIKFLETMGIPVINSYFTAVSCWDKFNTSIMLERAGVPVVPFGMAFNEDQTKELIKQLGNYPVVLKPSTGSWGRMLSKINDSDALEGVLEQKIFLGGPQHQAFYVQKYIEKQGRDIRSFVVGGKTIAAIYRTSPHWITNTARGGVATNCFVTKEIEQLGSKVSELLGGGILSLDIFESEEGLMVNEVNHTTEFKNSEVPTGVDISGKIIEYCISAYKKDLL